MKSKRSRTYLVSGLTLALIFVAIILVFRDVLPDIVKDLSTVPVSYTHLTLPTIYSV